MTRIIPLSFGLLTLPRDVGGYPTRDGRRVAWGKLLLRTGEAGLTRAEARQLDQHGITTHIELRFSDDGVPFPPVDFHLSHARSVVVAAPADAPSCGVLHCWRAVCTVHPCVGWWVALAYAAYDASMRPWQRV